MPGSRSARVARTTAISSTTCASGASRMSIRARPTISMLRTTRASPIDSASAVNSAREGPDTAHSSGASAARKTWRRSSTSSVASCWGPQPPASSELRLTSTSAAAPWLRAERMPESSGRAESEDPDATTWSRAERASRAEPRPRRTAACTDSASTLRAAFSWTDVEQLVQGVRAEETELEMLGAAPDRRWHLLRIGGGQHEDDMARRLFQRLEQRIGGGVGEHVDLVDDVDLPTTRRSQGGVRHQVAHGVDAVVGCGVQLVDVERRALGDLGARRTGAAGLALHGRRTVEGLGQDPRRRGLSGATRAAEEVGVGDPAVAHGALQRPHHVVLAPYLVEASRAKPPVERDEGDIGHGRRAYRCASDSRRRCSVRWPGWLRHPAIPAESCCLPALTRFTSGRCAGPGHRTQHRRTAILHASGVWRRVKSQPGTPAPGSAATASASLTGLQSRRRARAAESARLEIVCCESNRGFKSHRLRQMSAPLLTDDDAMVLALAQATRGPPARRRAGRRSDRAGRPRGRRRATTSGS